jgi:orotate phosphoribosyltransferase
LKDVDPTAELTLLTDVFTSGTTLRSALKGIRQTSGRLPSNILVCVDRKERAEGTSLSAGHELEREYGLNIHAIVDVNDVIQAMESGAISADEYLEKMIAYRSMYEGG